MYVVRASRNEEQRALGGQTVAYANDKELAEEVAVEYAQAMPGFLFDVVEERED